MSLNETSSSTPAVNETRSEPRVKYVAPRIERTQKLAEVTGQAASGAIVIPPS